MDRRKASFSNCTWKICPGHDLQRFIASGVPHTKFFVLALASLVALPVIQQASNQAATLCQRIAFISSTSNTSRQLSCDNAVCNVGLQEYSDRSGVRNHNPFGGCKRLYRPKRTREHFCCSDDAFISGTTLNKYLRIFEITQSDMSGSGQVPKKGQTDVCCFQQDASNQLWIYRRKMS